MEVSGTPSGFGENAAYPEGFTRGDPVILAARPSVGKSSLAFAIAHSAAKRGTGVLIFSLEMDAKQIVARFLGLNSRTDLLALRTGNIRDTGAAAARWRLAASAAAPRPDRGLLEGQGGVDLVLSGANSTWDVALLARQP